ncbi:hypothetical protein wVul_1033 [Wolbachia endosymbiont of Armadillidium vulgare str. wVulC]|nr:hypothetical protein wVul_0821 [Wolbachia endosymbiont of Armadillidium vulgare str. wVulC]KLT22668.1 hypothetical protein wVul_1033 [Wolbachia endosymbiont of Armadillidium vulgare str. wVulC]
MKIKSSGMQCRMSTLFIIKNFYIFKYCGVVQSIVKYQ